MNGYMHPGCYGRSLGGCSTKLSREHYISRGLLEQIHQRPIVESAVLGTKSGQRVGVGALTAKVLCTTHNSVLAPLDAEAAQVFVALDGFESSAANGSAALTKSVAADGASFERWLLKLAFGICKGGIATGTGGKITSLRNEERLLRVLFGEEGWPDGWGLYLATPETAFAAPANFGLEPRTHPETDELFQLIVWLRAVELWLCLGTPAPIQPEQFRPGGLRLLEAGSDRTLELRLSWPDHADHAVHEMTRIGQQDGWAQR